MIDKADMYMEAVVDIIITPYLENIFAACLVKCHYPNFLKLSRTILFPKPEKDAHLPASYRAIKHAFNIFAFVDDAYIAVRSKDHKTNCKILEWVHGQLQSWATENAVTFDPQKYHLLHFLGPGDRGMIKLRPHIDHLPPDEELFVEDEPFINILGVRVDNRLSWKFHIDHVVSRVSKGLRALKQMSGSTWGPDLQRMRMLYTSQIRPVFSYASPAWFVTGLSPRMPGTLSAKQVAVLDKLQDECLLEISGAMKGTCAHVIRKELCLPKMSDYLKMRTLAYIAKRTDHCPIYDAFEKERKALLNHSRSDNTLERHPLQQLRTQAEWVIEAAKERLEYHHGHAEMLEKWRHEKTRNRAIDTITRFALHAWCSIEWDQYREDWDKRHSWARPLALAEPWGFDSLLYYDEMCRKDCTMLLHCRTGHIGLAANLYSRDLHPTERCPLCGKDRHTIEHLFVYCTGRDCYGNDMSKRRATLYKNTEGLTDLHRIFTEYPEEAVKFAFKTFGIPQFTKASWNIVEEKRWNWSRAKKRGHSEATAGGDVDQDEPVRKRRHKHLRLRGDSPEPGAAAPDAAAAPQHVS